MVTVIVPQPVDGLIPFIHKQLNFEYATPNYSTLIYLRLGIFILNKPLSYNLLSLYIY